MSSQSCNPTDVGESSVPVPDDDRSVQNSDCSVGEKTETSIMDETESDRQQASAQAASLCEQQQDISLAFASMVTKLALLIDEKETENERLMGQWSQQSQQKRSEQADKCTNAVNAMAKKQAKLARQVEKIVIQLEESNRQKDLERVQLKKQLSQMKEKMRRMKNNVCGSYSGGYRSSLNKPPGIPTPKSRTSTSNGIQSSRNFGSPSVAGTQETEVFSIKEISFSSTIVDVTAMMSNNDVNDIDTTGSTSFSVKDEGSVENVRFLL
jgi:hypothetical protein